MPAYLITNVRFTNAEKAQEYGRQVSSTIEKYGGRTSPVGGRSMWLREIGDPDTLPLSSSLHSNRPSVGTIPMSTAKSSRFELRTRTHR